MSASVIAEIRTLSEPSPPQYAAAFKDLPRKGISAKLGITYTYVVDILNGTRKPGKKLEQKFIDLAEAVEAEMNQQEGRA